VDATRSTKRQPEGHPHGFARLFAWVMFTALPLWQAVEAGGLVWYWRVSARAITDPVVRRAEAWHVGYQLAVALAAAALSFTGGYLLLTAGRRGLWAAKVAFFLLMADALFHRLLVYLLPYPPFVKSELLTVLGGLTSPDMFLKAGLYGACLVYLAVSRGFAGELHGPPDHA